MRSRRLVAASSAVLATALLAGCTFSVGRDTAPAVPAEDIATRAADQLEAVAGSRGELDCGADPVHIATGRTHTCRYVEPVAGLEFDALVTFTEVTGSDYEMTVRVAGVPNDPPAPTAAPGAPVPVRDIEALAIRALAPRLGFVPVVTCEGEDVEVVVGTTVACSYPEGGRPVDAVVTITEFDGSRYAIRVD